MTRHHDFWGSSDPFDDSSGEFDSRHNTRKGDPLALRMRAISRNVCFGGKGGGDAPAADPAVGQAAMANVELGKDWLGFAKDQFAEGNARQDATDALNKQVVDQQLATQDRANTWAAEDRTRTKEVFQPLQDEFIQTAQNYDSPEKQAAAAAAAKADIQTGVASQQASNTRNMAAMGINPNSGRFAGIDRGAALAAGISEGGAQNQARQQVRDKALSLKADAINMGNGLASSTAAAYGIGLNAGNSAVGNNQSANNNFYQNGQQMSQGFQGNIGANQSAGGLLNQQYSTQTSAWNSQNQMAAAGSAATGSAIGGIAMAGAVAF